MRFEAVVYQVLQAEQWRLPLDAAASEHQNAHLFRGITGMSPYQFIKGVRMERARELLVEGELNVGAIARTLGYSSLSHFVNEFKRYFGVTPRSYADSQGDVVPLRMDLSTGPVRG